jgi:hypothetical protein
MKNNIGIIAMVMLCPLFSVVTLRAQSNDWETETASDGAVVKHMISERSDASGKKVKLVSYVASATVTADFKKITSIFKDVSRHKEFMGQTNSFQVKKLSELECIVYYFYKGVWPYPSSDVVTKMTVDEDVERNTTVFTLIAAPSMVEDKRVKRLDYYNVTWIFKKLENGHVEIRVAAKFTPAVQLPDFLMSTWFPDGPANYLSGIVQLANENK